MIYNISNKSYSINEIYDNFNNSWNQILIDFAFDNVLNEAEDESQSSKQGIGNKIVNLFKRIIGTIIKFFQNIKEKISNVYRKFKAKHFKKNVKNINDINNKKESGNNKSIKKLTPEQAKEKWPSPETCTIIDSKVPNILMDYSKQIENLDINKYMDISNIYKVENDNDLNKIKMIDSDAQKIYARLDKGSFSKEVEMKEEILGNFFKTIEDAANKNDNLLDYKIKNLKQLQAKYESSDASRLLPDPNVNNESVEIMTRITHAITAAYNTVSKGFIKVLNNGDIVSTKYNNLLQQGYPY